MTERNPNDESFSRLAEWLAPRPLLGELAVLNGWVTDAQLRECLDELKKSAPESTLEEILLRRRLITPERLSALVDQAKRIESDPGKSGDDVRAHPDRLFIDVAIREGFVTRDQVAACLRQEPGAPVREALLRKGILTREQSRAVTHIVRIRKLQAEDAAATPGGLEDVLADPVTAVGKGRRIGRYRLTDFLGEGGMGVVFRARDESIGREVALKMLKTVYSFNPQQVERFHREARNAASLRHPAIVTVFDVGQEGDVLYYTMEPVSGVPLNKFEGDLARRVSLLEEVARAVHYAHEQGIIHRDLKPANILVDAEGHPHLLDFGLSRDLRASSDLSRSGGILGTPQYLSPEQAIGRVDDMGPRTDVYALGAILYELMTGRVPFPGKSIPEIVHCLATKKPAVPAGPADLAAVCLKAIEKDPRNRYPTAAAFADDLARHLAGKPVEAVRRRSGRGWYMPAAVAVIVAIAAGAILWKRPADYWKPSAELMAFDGVDDFVEVEDSEALTPGTAMTISCWVYVEDIDETGDRIVSKWQSSIDDEYTVYLVKEGIVAFAWHTKGGNTWGTPSFNGVAGKGQVSSRRWTHIAVVRDGLIVAFYLDGKPSGRGRAADDQPFHNGRVSLRIGAEARGGEKRFFNGKIGDLRIYDRALPDSEVAALATTGRPEGQR